MEQAGSPRNTHCYALYYCGPGTLTRGGERIKEGQTHIEKSGDRVGCARSDAEAQTTIPCSLGMFIMYSTGQGMAGLCR